jgi:hypothetical protein
MAQGDGFHVKNERYQFMGIGARILSPGFAGDIIDGKPGNKFLSLTSSLWRQKYPKHAL